MAIEKKIKNKKTRKSKLTREKKIDFVGIRALALRLFCIVQQQFRFFLNDLLALKRAVDK